MDCSSNNCLKTVTSRAELHQFIDPRTISNHIWVGGILIFLGKGKFLQSIKGTLLITQARCHDENDALSHVFQAQMFNEREKACRVRNMRQNVPVCLMPKNYRVSGKFYGRTILCCALTQKSRISRGNAYKQNGDVRHGK